jgi:hypothetical protein
VSIATKYGILQHILCVALGGKSSSVGLFFAATGSVLVVKVVGFRIKGIIIEMLSSSTCFNAFNL